jgi:hypothetical protein
MNTRPVDFKMSLRMAQALHFLKFMYVSIRPRVPCSRRAISRHVPVSFCATCASLMSPGVGIREAHAKHDAHTCTGIRTRAIDLCMQRTRLGHGPSMHSHGFKHVHMKMGLNTCAGQWTRVCDGSDRTLRCDRPCTAARWQDGAAGRHRSAE